MLADKLQPFLDRYDELSRLLSDPSITADISNMTKLSKEQRSIEPIKEAANSYINTLKEIEENKSLLSDPEFGDLAKEELKNLEIQKEKLEEDIKILLLPKDPNDDKNISLKFAQEPAATKRHFLQVICWVHICDMPNFVAINAKS